MGRGLGGLQLVLQASVGDGDALNASSLLQDGVAPSVIHIGGRKIAQALVQAAVIVVGDEGIDARLKSARR